MTPLLIALVIEGSSPLTRGKLAGALGPLLTQRLIPAHAGKTRRRIQQGNHRPAHPRSRGENSLVSHVMSRVTGSSPLTRGKPADRACDRVPGGLIPAHAGKTASRSRAVPPPPAHPRSRGENAGDVSGYAVLGGSSPLTRGKLTDLVPALPSIRLIPAHAGKTTSLLSVVRN